MRLLGRTVGFAGSALLLGLAIQAQMIDNTQAPNTAKAGINKSLIDEIGAGRGDVMTVGSSSYLIHRDPFRSEASSPRLRTPRPCRRARVS